MQGAHIGAVAQLGLPGDEQVQPRQFPAQGGVVLVHQFIDQAGDIHFAAIEPMIGRLCPAGEFEQDLRGGWTSFTDRLPGAQFPLRADLRKFRIGRDEVFRRVC